MSDEETHSKILAFLAAELSKKDERQCTSIDLSYSPPGFRHEKLRTWDRHENPEQFENLTLIEQMVHQITEIVEGHADTFGSGKHSYTVRTTQLLGSRTTLRFNVPASYTASDLALTTSQGGAGGGSSHSNGHEAMAIVSQNNQALMRTNQAMFQSSFGTLAMLTDQMRDENIKLRNDNISLRRQLEEAQSIREDREFETALKVEKNQRTNEGFKKLLQIGTVVAAKIAGGDTSKEDGGAPSPMKMLIAEFTKSLSKPQIAQLFQILDQGQQLLLFQIMEMAAPPKEPAPTTS